jgi:hypothetical protein
MVHGRTFGSSSGRCIEARVALHARVFARRLPASALPPAGAGPTVTRPSRVLKADTDGARFEQVVVSRATSLPKLVNMLDCQLR